MKAAAKDQADVIRNEHVERLAFIREFVQARGEVLGAPEVGAGLDASLSDLWKEQA